MGDNHLIHDVGITLGHSCTSALMRQPLYAWSMNSLWSQTFLHIPSCWSWQCTCAQGQYDELYRHSVKLWNALPQHKTNSPNIVEFQHLYKNHFFEKLCDSTCINSCPHMESFTSTIYHQPLNHTYSTFTMEFLCFVTTRLYDVCYCGFILFYYSNERCILTHKSIVIIYKYILINE